MPTCPRCRQSVDSQAIHCPYCRTALKAHGHPGIPLYRAEETTYLCDTCLYHEDDSCNFPQRPYAKECTLYHNHQEPLVSTRPRPRHWQTGFPMALPRTEGWLILAGLLVVSLLIVLANRS